MTQYQMGLACMIGAPVQAIDGPFGHLHAVILNPHLDRVVALVVRSGLLPPQDGIVLTWRSVANRLRRGPPGLSPPQWPGRRCVGDPVRIEKVGHASYRLSEPSALRGAPSGLR